MGLQLLIRSICIYCGFCIVFSVHSQIIEEAPLTDDERHLAKLFNQSMLARGLKVLPVSKKLTRVARWNIWDLLQNKPQEQEGCGIYSWSNQKKWSAFCSNDDADWRNYWKKPEEISSYQGMLTAQVLTHFSSVQGAIERLNNFESFWEKNLSLGKAYGISINDGFMALWIGINHDPSGYHSIADRLSNISGFWYSPEKDGVGFQLTTLANGQTTLAYYGKTNSGGNLWLVSVPIHINSNEETIIDMYEATEGTFLSPTSTTKLWGTLTIKLTSCAKGSAVLDGVDGKLIFEQLQLLAKPDQVECR